MKLYCINPKSIQKQKTATARVQKYEVEEEIVPNKFQIFTKAPKTATSLPSTTLKWRYVQMWNASTGVP